MKNEKIHMNMTNLLTLKHFDPYKVILILPIFSLKNCKYFVEFFEVFIFIIDTIKNQLHVSFQEAIHENPIA